MGAFGRVVNPGAKLWLRPDVVSGGLRRQAAAMCCDWLLRVLFSRWGPSCGFIGGDSMVAVLQSELITARGTKSDIALAGSSVAA